jgi:hypothetical protein
MTTTSTQIVRENPDIEAYRLRLLREAENKALNVGQADLASQLPGYQVAGFSPQQLAAIKAVTDRGIGAYNDYLTAANTALGAGYATTGEAADTLRGADTRAQFTDAQRALGQAGGAAANMTAGIGGIQTGFSNLDAAGQRALAADTTSRFTPAYGDIGAGIASLGAGQGLMAQYQQANLRGAQDVMAGGIQGLSTASQMALDSRDANQQGIQQGIGALYQGAGQAQQAARSLGPAPQVGAAQTGFRPDLQTFQMGPAERVITRSFGAPGTAESMMSPYMQNVVAIQQREAQRQADIARAGRSAQAVRAGAFGGTREGVVEAEAQRNLATQLGDIQAQGLQQAFQQGQQQFNTEQQARLAAQQANQQAGLAVGQQNLGAQLGVQQLGAQMGQQSDLANLANRQQAGLANQAMQGQYGLAGLQADLQAAQMMQGAGTGQIGASSQQGQLGLQAAQTYGQLANQQIGAGQTLGQQQLQQAGLGQSAAGQLMQSANIYGQLAGQQGALAGQESNINQNISNLLAQQGGQYGAMAGQLANIYGQQANQFQNLGQGIGQLAGQQFSIGQAMSSGLGQLGAQLGQQGIQQAALGQTAQAMNQGDISYLYNMGQAQQALNQQVLDAQRASDLQRVYAPYQQMGFAADIYRGTPSSQSATTIASQPQASPFQQVAGTAIGGLAAGTAAKKANLI